MPSTSLGDLLNYTPDPLLQSPDYFPYPSRLSPVTFYDKHLDSSLILKHVKPIPGPSLSNRLRDIVDQALQNPAVSHDTLLSEVAAYRCEDTDPCTVSGAVSVAHSYQRGFSDAVIKVASTLLSPSAPDNHWSSVLQWSSNQRLPSQPEGLYSAEYGLQIPLVKIKESHKLDVNSNTVLHKLVSSNNRISELAIWEVFAVTAEDLIRNMGSGDASSSFHWATSMDQGVPPPLTRTTKPLDAPAFPLLADILQLDFGRSSLTIRLKPSSKRTPAKGKGKNKTTSTNTNTIHESNHLKPPRQRGPDPHHFLQHAWTRAVINDATFIIFHCGNLERIGIRHRQSQTLYLSEPIEIAGCEDPAYGKLQVGLYLAILQDLESRLRSDLLLDEASDRDAAGLNGETLRAGKKRASEESDYDRTLKKQKLGSEEHENTNPVPDFEPTTAQAEVSSRNVAFMRLQYDAYQSPVLAPVLRTNPDLSPSRVQIYSKRFRPPRRKATYLPHEYFTITLGPQVHSNDDATNHEDLPYTSHIATHTATLEVTLSDEDPRKVSHKNVLVKLGFSPKEKQMLQHEYRVYERLARRGVKLTVPYVFGMFHSSDSAVDAPLALVLTDDGEALSSMEDSARRMRKGTPGHWHDEKVKVSPTEKATFFAALAAIHRAGVLHGNIHPSNLRISKTTGAVQITNFGDARLDSDVVDGDVYVRERQQLKQLLVVEATEVHFHRVKPLTLGLGGGRYFATGSDLYDDNHVDDDDESEVHWSQETGGSLVIND